MKEIYAEAIAEAKKIREVAIQDAQNSVLEALVPRIKSFVDQNILESSISGPPRIQPNVDEFEEVDEVPVQAEPIVGSERDPACDDLPVSAVVEPAAGKSVELAFDVGVAPVLQPVYEAVKSGSKFKVSSAMLTLKEHLNKMSKNSDLVRTKPFLAKINKIKSGLENIYDYVQETVSNKALRSILSEQLETQYEELTNKLQEGTMKNRRSIREADDMGADAGATGTKRVSLNVDVPEDVADDLISSLEDIEVSIEDDAGEDDMGGDADASSDDLDLGGDDMGGDDLGGDDMGGDAPAPEGDDEEEGSKLQLNSRLLDDNTIIEIDERVLRNEIAKLRSVREASGFPTPSADGAGVSADVLDDFGGATDEGDPFEDGEVTTADTQSVSETIKRKIAYEARVQQSARSNGSRLKREHAKARAAGQLRRSQQLSTSYTNEVRRFNESVKRANKFKAQLTEMKLTRGSNNHGHADGLRKKLSESNLDNVKLQFANKLLLQSNITNQRKKQIIEQLDQATTPREAKLIFENAVQLVSTESVTRAPAGSASRPTRSGSTSATLTEGFEVARWASLAGIR